jgi:hypothetical protein
MTKVVLLSGDRSSYKDQRETTTDMKEIKTIAEETEAMISISCGERRSRLKPRVNVITACSW